MSAASCRAAVAKHYSDGEERHTDPRTGRTVIVSTSDVCGMVLMPIYFERGARKPA